MTDQRKPAKHPQSRTDTLIGAGTRFEGTVTFTGVLRIDGEVLGDVVGGGDPQGMVAVGKHGSVSGAIRAPHVLVAGRVDGDVTVSGSLEVLRDACVKGDATYHQLVIHEGGVIEGLLTPHLPDVEIPNPPPVAASAVAASVEPLAVAAEPEPPALPPAIEAPPVRSGLGLRNAAVAVAVTVAVGVAAVLWVTQSGSEIAKPAAPQTPQAALQPTPAPVAPLPEPSAPASAPTPVPVVSAPVPVASAAPPVAAVPAVVPSTAAAPPPPARDETVVKGDDAGKPGDFVYVVAGKEAALLFKRRHPGDAEGAPIELAPGKSKRIPLGRDEALRVDQGRDLQIFFQGRKVSASTLNSGAWMRFVPSS